MDSDGKCLTLWDLLGDEQDIWVEMQDLDDLHVCVRVSGEAEFWNGEWHIEEEHIEGSIIGFRPGACDKDIQRDNTVWLLELDEGDGSKDHSELIRFFARWSTNTIRQATSQVPQLINRVEA